MTNSTERCIQSRMPKKTKSREVTPIYVTPTKEIREAVDARAAAERRTVRQVVIDALEAYLSTPVK